MMRTTLFYLCIAAFLYVSTAPAAHAQVQVKLPDVTGQPGETKQAPIKVGDVGDVDIYGVQFDISYDPSVVTIEDVLTTGTITEEFNITVNTTVEGEVKVAAAGTSPLAEGDTLVQLQIRLLEEGTTPLRWDDFQFNEGTPAASPENGSVSVETTPPEDEVPPPPNGLTADAGSDGIQLQWSGVEVDDLQRYRLYRGRTPIQGTPQSQAAPFDSVGADLNAYLDSSVVQGQTFYYRVTAVDTSGQESSFSAEARAFFYEETATVAVSISRTFGSATTAEGYRLVALPGEVDRSLASTLSGEAGIEWQAFWDDGSESDYLVRFDGSDRFDFRPGVGFWLIANSDWTVDDTFPVVSLDGQYRAQIDLHDGWNIISNPLDRPVPWSAVEAASDQTLQALWQLDGGFATADTFRSATAGRAYYFLNNQGLDSLSIPYPGTPNDPSEAEAKSLRAAQSSAFTIEAYQNGVRSSGIQIGWHDEAKDGLDAFDQFAPPSRFEKTYLRLKAPVKVESERRAHLAHEWRPRSVDGHVFDLILTAEGEAVTLRASGLEEIIGPEIRLLNPATGRSYDLRNTTGVTFHPDGEPLPLTLAVGPRSFVEETKTEIAPETLKLRPNYPNPFSDQTTLEYALPERTRVQIAVYDLLGRQVRVLQSNEQRAGTHHIKWDGRNSAGQRVASGLYLVRLEAMDQKRHQKITLVR